MKLSGKRRTQAPRQLKKEEQLRYIDPAKVKLLLGNILPYSLLAKLIDVDLVALNNEAVVRMGGGGVKPNYLAEEYRGTVLGVVDEMEKYNRKLISNPELMRESSFYPAPFDLTIRHGFECSGKLNLATRLEII